jgi:hypothetical protein
VDDGATEKDGEAETVGPAEGTTDIDGEADQDGLKDGIFDDVIDIDSTKSQSVPFGVTQLHPTLHKTWHMSAWQLPNAKTSIS